MDQIRMDDEVDLVRKYSTGVLRWATSVSQGNTKEAEREEQILNALLQKRTEIGIAGNEFERKVYNELERMEELWEEALRGFEGETPKRAELSAIRLSLRNYPDPVQRAYRPK